MNDYQLKELLEQMTVEELKELIQQCNEKVLGAKVEDNNPENCPHCGSTRIIKYGKNKFNKQRYQCECKKVFISTTNRVTHGTWKSLNQWMNFLHHCDIGSSLRVCARECNISENTANRWRHKISMALYLLDETFYERLHATSKERLKRGISDQKVNIACAIDENKNKIIQVSIPGRITTASLNNIYKNRIKEKSIVISDSLRSYHKLMKNLNVHWKKIPNKKKSIENYTLDKVNHLHSGIKYFLAHFRGISMEYLQDYIEMYKVNDRYKKSKDTTTIDRLMDQLMSIKSTLTCSMIDKKLLEWIV